MTRTCGSHLVVCAVGFAVLLVNGCGSTDSPSTGFQRARVQSHSARQQALAMRHQARMIARRHHARMVARQRRHAELRQVHREEAAEQAASEQVIAEEAQAEEEANECDPNYAGACLDPYASDYDCEGGDGNGPDYTGTVTVVGEDHYGLDADGDGTGCEAE